MTKKWLVPVVSIVVIIFAIIGIKVWHTYETTEVIEEESIKLNQTISDSINRIEIRDDKTHIFIKENEGWKYERYPDLLYNQETLKTLAEELAQMTAYKTIRNVQDLNVYGIHEYARMITVYTTPETKADFVIGDYIDSEEAYYVWCVETEILGIVPKQSLEVATGTINRWIAGEIILPDVASLNHLKITNKDQVLLEIQKDQGIWYATKPYENVYSVSEEMVNQYLGKLRALTKESFVAPLEGNEEKYGFAEPRQTITLGEDYVLKFGDTQDGHTYLTYGSDPYIYQVAVDQVKEIEQIKPFDWLTKEIMPPMQQFLKQVKIAYQDKIYTIVPVKVDETLEIDETAEADKVVAIDEAVTKQLEALSKLALYAPVAQATLEEKNPREAEVIIRYTYQDGKECVLEFVPYDPSFYLLRSNGIVEFSVEKKPIMDVIKIMNEGIQ